MGRGKRKGEEKEEGEKEEGEEEEEEGEKEEEEKEEEKSSSCLGKNPRSSVSSAGTRRYWRLLDMSVCYCVSYLS